MREVKRIIDQIASTSARTEKERIITENKDNQLFKEILYRVYNPYIVYGIGDKKLKKFIKNENGAYEFDDLISLLDYLEVHNTGDDETVRKVATFINLADDELKQFYTNIVLKKLKIGATAKTFNKIFGKGFIPEFNVQLAKKFYDEVHKIKGKEFVLTEKLDGVRCLLFVESGKVKAFSRQGQPIFELIDIFDEAKNLTNGVYDGELLIGDADDYKDRDVLQQTLKIARKDGEKRNLVLHVFDYVTIDEFNEGKSKKTYIDRRKFIENEINSKYKWIQVLPILYQGKDLDVIPDMLTELETKGKEGLMLNTVNGLYVTKRTDQLLKIKTMNEFDEVVLDVVEGDGKYKGKLGAIVVNYKGFPLQVGSGFTDEQREYYFEHKDEIIGRVVTIQYFRESKNQNGGLSVSFPVFKTIREEGKEVSYY